MTVPFDKIPAKAYVYGKVFTLSNRMQSVGDRRDGKVTTMQCFMIANLTLFDDYQLNLSEMSKLLGTSRQNVKKTAVLLAKKGYLDFRPDQKDGRNIRVALTEQGKAYYQHREAMESEYLEKLFEGLDDELVDRMKEGFGVIWNNLGKIEKQQLKEEK